MNGPDLILKFLNHMNGIEQCRICGTIKKKKKSACEMGLRFPEGTQAKNEFIRQNPLETLLFSVIFASS